METKETNQISVTLAAVLVLTGLTGAGFFYMWHEMGEILKGVSPAGSESKITDLKNSVLYYTLFMALIIFGSVSFVASAATRKLREDNVRLEDTINVMDSQIDDLKTQNSAFEERIKLKESEMQKADRFQDTSIVDRVSGLFNQHYFFATLPNEINRAKRDKKQLVVVLIDIGEAKRDPEKLLRYAGELKKCAKRAGDFSFRFEDGTFGVIFSGLSLENSRRFVVFIRESLEAVFGEEQFGPLFMGVSLAFAESLPEADLLHKKAEKALKKAQGSGEPVVYDIIE